MSLAKSVESAVAAMPWITESDQVGVELALTYARQIDGAIEFAEGQEVTKALYLGPHLLNTMRALGGAPAERKALAGEVEIKGKLAAMRVLPGGRDAGAPKRKRAAAK